jgi:hypothetical protein
MDKNQEILILKQQVAELLKWKEEKTRQQISYPLDKESIKILNKDFMSIVSTLYRIGGVAGNTFTEFLGKQEDRNFIVSENTYIPYSVDLSTNLINIGNYYLDEDRSVELITDDTPPDPLNYLTTYYVINSTGSTFNLTTVQGNAGAIVTLTNKGAGNNYLVSYGY